MKKTLLIILILGLAGCGRGENLERYRETKLLMGTFVHLDVCTEPGQEGEIASAYAEAWERLGEIHWRMSRFDSRSDVTHINRSFGRPVRVGADTYQLIKLAFEWSRVTKGAFDISVGPLINLWKRAQEKNRLPDVQEIRAVQAAMGTSKLQMHPGNYVEILRPDTRIDLGGIAKGYAVDEAARILKSHGFSRVFIDAGGDIYVSGLNCQGRPWRIGIRDPRHPTKILETVELTDAAVTTSGSYEQFFTIDGVRWSHIINPLTGYPQKGVVSATAIAPTAATADALSTALCVLPVSEGLKVADSLGEGYAAMVVSDLGQGKLRTVTSSRYRGRAAH